eukprot:6455995-Amphidinium_carterae.2
MPGPMRTVEINGSPVDPCVTFHLEEMFVVVRADTGGRFRKGDRIITVNQKSVRDAMTLRELFRAENVTVVVQEGEPLDGPTSEIRL